MTSEYRLILLEDSLVRKFGHVFSPASRWTSLWIMHFWAYDTQWLRSAGRRPHSAGFCNQAFVSGQVQVTLSLIVATELGTLSSRLISLFSMIGQERTSGLYTKKLPKIRETTNAFTDWLIRTVHLPGSRAWKMMTCSI